MGDLPLVVVVVVVVQDTVKLVLKKATLFLPCYSLAKPVPFFSLS